MKKKNHFFYIFSHILFTRSENIVRTQLRIIQIDLNFFAVVAFTSFFTDAMLIEESTVEKRKTEAKKKSHILIIQSEENARQC